MSIKKEYKGTWNYEFATELDKIAYSVYIKQQNILGEGKGTWTYLSLNVFVKYCKEKKYYKEANILLRNKKIDKIKNETVI